MWAGFQGFKIRILSVACQAVERRAMRVEIAIDGTQRGMEELGRRERQLITLRRRSRLPRTASIQPLARTPSAAQLLIEIVGDPGRERARPRLIRGDQPLTSCLDEEYFPGIEEEVGRL